MERLLGCSVFIATPALVGYGIGKLFGLSKHATRNLAIAGGLLGLTTIVVIVEALKKLE